MRRAAPPTGRTSVGAGRLEGGAAELAAGRDLALALLGGVWECVPSPRSMATCRSEERLPAPTACWRRALSDPDLRDDTRSPEGFPAAISGRSTRRSKCWSSDEGERSRRPVAASDRKGEHLS